MKVVFPDNLHEVISHKDESVPLFESKFLDFFSRVAWYVPLILFVPVIVYCLYVSSFKFNFSALSIFGFFLLGLLLWSLVEYFAHRYVFHFEPKRKWLKKIFFIIHGVHHAYPGDSMRLVMPPSLSIPLSTFFYFLFYFTLSQNHMPIFAGFIFGYLCYDMIHYGVHHAHFIKIPWFLKMKQHHMVHHFKEPDLGFGVTSDVWDNVMKITFKSKH